jgi:hypothetical protein
VSIANPQRTLALPRLIEGDYYWSVQAETSEGFDISAAAPSLIRVLPIPRLPEAANRVPAAGQIFGPAELRSRTIAFSWSPVAGASGYLFTLLQETGDGALTERLPVRALRDPGSVIEDLTIHDAGNFIWRLEAVVTESRAQAAAMPAGAGPAGTMPAADLFREENQEPELIFQRGETGENRFTLNFLPPVMPYTRKPGVLYGRE